MTTAGIYHIMRREHRYVHVDTTNDWIAILIFLAPGRVFFSDMAPRAVFHSDTRVNGAVFHSDTRAHGAVFHSDT